MNNPIPLDSLPAGSTATARGIISRCRIASFIDGEELEQFNKNAAKPVNRKFTELNVLNPEVQPLDRNNPTQTELHVHNRIAPAKNGQNAGTPMLFTRSKSNTLPPVFMPDDNGGYKQITLEADLATGTPVRIVQNVFTTPQGNGLGIQAVILEGEPTYRSTGAGAVDALNALGLTVSSTLPMAAPQASAPEQAQAPQSQEQAQPLQGIALPNQQQAAPQQAPAQGSYGQQGFAQQAQQVQGGFDQGQPQQAAPQQVQQGFVPQQDPNQAPPAGLGGSAFGQAPQQQAANPWG